MYGILFYFSDEIDFKKCLAALVQRQFRKLLEFSTDKVRKRIIYWPYRYSITALISNRACHFIRRLLRKITCTALFNQ